MSQKYDNAVNLFITNYKLNENSANTIETYSRVLRYYSQFLAKHGYDEPSIQSTAEWKASLVSKDSTNSVSLVTADMYLRILKMFSDFAVECELLPNVIMTDKMMLNKKKVKNERLMKDYDHVLSEEDVQALINAEKATYGKTSNRFIQARAVVTLSLMSGLRNIELRNLKMSNLHFSEGYIYVEITKGGKPRYVPFSDTAQKAINAYLNSGIRPSSAGLDDYLFGVTTREGIWRQYERTELSEMILRYEKSVIGEEKASRSHALRHCFASNARENGMALEDISQILGHRSLGTSLIYAKNNNPDMFAANFGKRYENAVVRERVS